VLTFGYDFAIKGIDVALDAFERFDPAHRFTLGICVAGRRAQAQAALCARFGETPAWVELLGPREDMGAYYRAADVFLSASRTEGMPYAVLEAAYCGLPLVLSDIAPHRQLGLPQAEWFPQQDAAALFDAVTRAAQTSGTTQNAAFVAQRYSMRNWTKRVTEQLFPKKEHTV
jgi:glycosyltransferase involved in cell wall biosynthesis